MTCNKSKLSIRQRQRVLFVDDDLSFLHIANSILTAKGYDIDTVNCGREAIYLAESRAYNCVILDIHLPDMSGVELLSNLINKQPDIIAIMLTGYSSVENSIEALNRGAFAFLEKPLDPNKLLETINKGLEKQTLLNENHRLVKELERKNRDLNILLSISQTSSSILNPRDMIQASLNILSNTMENNAGYFFYCKNSKGDLYEFKNICGEYAEELKNRNTALYLMSVINNNSDMHINIDALERNDKLKRFIILSKYKYLAGIPMNNVNDVIGFILVASTKSSCFTEDELALLKAAGREIAAALTNIYLMEEASNAKALRELDKMRTELLANVSHELRTPLAAIKGFASSLLQPDISFDEDTRQSFIQTIDSESDRLSQLIEDLLLMTRIEGGAFHARKEPYEVGEIISSIRDRLYNLTLKHNLKIYVPDNLPVLIIDGPRISQVISNLVENAVKYSEKGNEIKIEVEQKDCEIIISVTDHGVGIPEEYKSMVFERFNQVAAKTGGRKGNGLGLCICRGIVESHGGRIWFESIPGKGTKFSFSLPIAEQQG
jgi:K+-sensing histidine kinase KdpD